MQPWTIGAGHLGYPGDPRMPGGLRPNETVDMEPASQPNNPSAPPSSFGAGYGGAQVSTSSDLHRPLGAGHSR